MMRLELALVVGILLFCSWCAYIVARMSSSVNVASQPTQTGAGQGELDHTEQHHQLINQTGSGSGGGGGHSPILIDHSLMASSEANRHQRQQQPFIASAGLQQQLQLQQPEPPQQQQQQQQQQLQQTRHFDASEPIPARQPQYRWLPYANPQHSSPGPQYYNQQQPPNSGYATQPAQANNQWQAYALPTSLTTAPSSAVYEPEELAATEDDEEEEAGPDGGSIGAGGGGEQPDEELPPPDGTEEGQQMAASEDPDYEARNQQLDPEQDPTEPTEDYEETDLQGGPTLASSPQSELEEISNRRSFNELESDSNERDKDGHLIVTRRRHLINGKPVRPAQVARRRLQRRHQPQRATGGSRPAGRNNHKSPLQLATAASGEDKEPTLETSNKLDHNSPEGPTGAQLKRDDNEDDKDEEYGEEESPSSIGSAASSERDFERMVHEIDQEDKLRRATAAKTSSATRTAPGKSVVTTPAASEPSGSMVSGSADRRYHEQKQQQQPQGLPFSSLNATTSETKLERRADYHTLPAAAFRSSGPGSGQTGVNVVGADGTVGRTSVRRQQQPGRGPAAKAPKVALQSKTSNRRRRLSSASQLAAPPPLAPKDSHQHRLQETLTSQQWDDDSTGQPDGQEAASKGVEELRNDEDQDQVDNIVGRDEEARQLERLSRDLLQDSARVPEELERRKRQAPLSLPMFLGPDERQTNDGNATVEAPTDEDHGTERDDGRDAGDSSGSNDGYDRQRRQRPLASISALAPLPDPLSPRGEPPPAADTSGLANSTGGQPTTTGPGLGAALSIGLRARALPAALVEGERQIRATNGSDDLGPTKKTTPVPNWKVMAGLSEKRAEPPSRSANDDLRGAVAAAASSAPPQPQMARNESSYAPPTTSRGLMDAIKQSSASALGGGPMIPGASSGAPPSGAQTVHQHPNDEPVAPIVSPDSSGASHPAEVLADAAANVSDVVDGSEDMQVSVLANPPPPLPLPIPPTATTDQQQQQQSNLYQQPPPTALNAGAPFPIVPPVYATTSAASGVTAPSGPLVGHRPEGAAHLASGSHKVAKRKKKRLKKKLTKKKRSKLFDSKFKAASAYANKQKRRMKKGNMRKKKRKSEKELVASKKHFEGLLKGRKLGHGHQTTGGKKGSAYLKDKGYKKKGFKRSYHKLETGDHKTYFDEFRDKDHKKKWKDFDDKHKYSKKKKWAGYDSKRMDQYKLRQSKGKAAKLGNWRERSKLEHSGEANKYRKSKKYGSLEGSMKLAKSVKKKKKKEAKKVHEHH